ncbi:tyrosine-protein kinase receptor Tie-1-like [Centruroides vittatus]|uniref:tyrosine-protein kinase receptor Tie-1-like n=1 Tax=Centruroides vittatus TaxID=120091 RepID=UPI0035105BD1
MLSGVLSYSMWKYTVLLPTSFTITKNIGDQAKIKMNTVSNFPYVNWKKNEVTYNSLRGVKADSYINFHSLEIGDAGFYSLNKDDYNRGITRLIVRVCQDGIYGPLCEHQCPNCLNGGVCHDLTGDCICPPGFNGTLCENACKPGFFGRDCGQQCFKREQTTYCAEILFCLPDPYGCSCISGFTSVFCNESCASGFYGAGCTQKCSHCKNSNQCEAKTGKCPDGCEEGWHGTPCVLRMGRK